MRTEKIDLYAYFGLKKEEGAKGYLYTYVLDSYDFCPVRKRPAMLVLGGGGYAYVSDREKEPIALSFSAKGFNSYVLDYSVAPVKYPAQILEACMAVAYIRQNADRDSVIEDKIAGIGFSAGGHLLGMLVTADTNKDVKGLFAVDKSLYKLNGAIFSYAVITSGEYTHQGSMDNLFNGDLDKRVQFSIENRINKDSCPAFIWCTADDTVVPSENSLLLANAYKINGVPFELHVFNSGVHGLSLCNPITATKQMLWGINKECEGWQSLAYIWLDKLGFCVLDND